ncbi:MAG TPA: LamG domain-containing protein [Candidatus Polarisedimenticolaceae bacterium]|nr:LamG domain-containing protein [Candidatus Polarisedimenticolaceae bacterium]
MRQPMRCATLLLSAGAFGLLRAQTCDPIPKGAVGWWPGDGAAVDLAAPGSAGVLMNGATFAAGVDGQGFSLDGINDRVDVPDAPELRPAHFTLSAWVRVDLAAAGACILCKQVGAGDANSYSLWLLNGVLRGGMFRFAEAIAPSVFPVGQIVHIATTYDGTVIRLYMDGKQIAIAAGPASPPGYDTAQLIIGADDNGANFFEGYFKGLIDEPMLFNRALSACEIRALVRARTHGACKGDADADSIKDFQDNCAGVANLGQQDVDADGVGDVCDCAPADPQVFAAPGSYAGLYFDTHDDLTWCGEPSLEGPATTYDLIRGDLDELPVGVGVVACRSHCLPPLSGLVSWWAGDGNASALVGGGGTFQNGAANGAGWVRQAFAFDGVDDRVQTPALTLGNTFSVAAWVNSDVLNQGSYRRLLETQFGAGFEIGSDAAGTGYKFIVHNPSAPYGTAQGGTIDPGRWQLVVGTYDGANGTLYVDGSAVASGPFTPPGTQTLPVYIGAYYLGGVGWNGIVDEAQIYNRALTAAEVRAMYEAGSAGECKAALGGIDALFTSPFASDAAVPALGHGFFYLERGQNSCGTGTYGTQSNGTPRTSPACN